MLQHLNPSQQKAVTHKTGPLLILAGAGSGKTRALTYRAAYLIKNQNIPPERILLTTFTNKAAGEMQERLHQLVGHKLPFAGTFHSLCARLLRIHGSHIGLDSNYIIYDTRDQIETIKQSMKKLSIDPKEIKPGAALGLIDNAKNELIGPKQYSGMAGSNFYEKIAAVYTQYQRLLKEYNALDFSDLLFVAVNLLKTNQALREKYQDQFLHVLVDEYQDTNKAQYQLTKLFALKHKNVCVVGDASQAIYSWRGADYRNLSLLKQDFSNLTTIRLEQNYRSTQNILDAAYGVINNNKTHPILSLWTDHNPGDMVNIYEAKNEYEEIKYIIRYLETDDKNNDNNNQTAILYRTNAQSRVAEELLIQHGIPYTLVGGVKFYERKEVKDVLAYLRYAYNRNDQVSLDRIIKLGKRRFEAYESWLNQADLDEPPLDLLEDILKVTKYLTKYNSKIEEDANRIENVQELKSVAQQFTSLSELLENVALVEEEPSQDSNHNKRVTLMTLHASKGLEFDQVFMIGMEEGLFPHSRTLLDAADLEEERRLCYVGMTRACQSLHLTYAKSRVYFGSRSHNSPSRFLSEIPEQVKNTSSITKKNTHNKPIDDSILDAFLEDEIDIDEFLR